MQRKQFAAIAGIALTVAATWGVLGCASQQKGVAAPETPAQRANTLVPYRDPWRHARPRLWDIADRPLNDFIEAGKFDYTRPKVVLHYDEVHTAPYFSGRVEAKGLKPNFAYQMKLAGKPSKGTRGWGAQGDDVANGRLGAVGRWWCESTHEGTAYFDDEHYRRYYNKAKTGHAHNMYGYLFLGTFVTDENGEANFSFKGDRCYHITWRDEQQGAKDIEAGTYTPGSTAGFGYGATVEPKTVKLWYEFQDGRSRNVKLPKGTYRCRFLLTEETFHNLLGGTRDELGGYWQTVLANEDLDKWGKPDGDAGNDVVFTIR